MTAKKTIEEWKVASQNSGVKIELKQTGACLIELHVKDSACKWKDRPSWDVFSTMQIFMNELNRKHNTTGSI